MTLTISIPTYNRAKELRVLLDEIWCQASELPNGVLSVVVSDNASTDTTTEMVESMRQKFAGRSVALEYRRNETNVGFSPNVISSVEKVSGDYVLIMGDDDSFESGTLRYLFEQISEHPEADVFFLKSIEYDCELSRRVSESTVESSDVRVFSDGVKYIEATRGFPPALVSGYVVRKSAWLASGAPDFAYSMCVHMLAVARLLFRHVAAVEICRPCIKYRGGQTNSTWSRDDLYPFRFYLDSLMAVKLMPSDADHHALKILRRLSMRTIAFYLLRQKVTGHPFDRRQFYDYYRRAQNGLDFYSFVVAVIRMSPTFVLRIVFGRWIRKINKRIGFCWKGES